MGFGDVIHVDSMWILWGVMIFFIQFDYENLGIVVDRWLVDDECYPVGGNGEGSQGYPYSLQPYRKHVLVGSKKEYAVSTFQPAKIVGHCGTYPMAECI